jgi:hypothetical protein
MIEEKEVENKIIILDEYISNYLNRTKNKEYKENDEKIKDAIYKQFVPTKILRFRYKDFNIVVEKHEDWLQSKRHECGWRINDGRITLELLGFEWKIKPEDDKLILKILTPVDVELSLEYHKFVKKEICLDVKGNIKDRYAPEDDDDNAVRLLSELKRTNPDNHAVFDECIAIQQKEIEEWKKLKEMKAKETQKEIEAKKQNEKSIPSGPKDFWILCICVVILLIFFVVCFVQQK